MATITEFTELRDLILKNALYNRILTSVSLKETTFPLASTLKTLKEETKSELKKDVKRKRLPTYALYDIIVSISKDYFSVGIKYQNHPIIWEHPKIDFRSYKNIAEFVYKKYSINPAKSDKIFSNISKDVKVFLQQNAYSENFWRLGFSKKLTPKAPQSVNIQEVENYLKKLHNRNIEYRAFNTILVKVLKNKVFFNEGSYGSLLVQPSMYSTNYCVRFDSRFDWKTYNDIFPITAFSPTEWNKVKSDIDKVMIVGIV